jgi:hypothetical protein
MRLSSPEPDAFEYTLSDWLELQALASGRGEYPVENLVNGYELALEEEPADPGETDGNTEDIMQRAASEILNRARVLGASYPFHLTDDGSLIKRRPEVTEGAVVYLFCLWLSQASTGGLISVCNNGITDEDRDLFQICATLAAGGFLEGHARSFGWPRPDGSAFMEALTNTFRDMGEGTPKQGPNLPVGVSSRTKDAGIDVIAWRDVPDRICGRLYLVGQAASGRDWSAKSVKPMLEAFHNDFFTEVPPSPAIPALFSPFCVQEFTPVNRAYSTTANTAAFLTRITRDFGIVFYRYRMSFFAARGIEFANRHRDSIQRINEFQRVRNRVDAIFGLTERLE